MSGRLNWCPSPNSPNGAHGCKPVFTSSGPDGLNRSRCDYCGDPVIGDPSDPPHLNPEDGKPIWYTEAQFAVRFPPEIQEHPV